MAFLGLSTPHATARLLNEVNVEGTKVDTSHSHITIMYLGKGLDIGVLAKAMMASYAVTSKTPPFSVRTSRVTCFPKNDDGVPIIARIESDRLHELRKNLESSFEEHAVTYNKKFPVYKPHVTLSYAKEEIEEFRIPTIEWGAHELVLWGGDEGDKKVVITFPFALQPLDKTAARVADRYAANV